MLSRLLSRIKAAALLALNGLKLAPGLALKGLRTLPGLITNTLQRLHILIHNSLKTVAVFLVCTWLVVGLAYVVATLTPSEGVSSHQYVHNLPKLAPSAKYDYKRAIVRLFINGEFTCSGVVIGSNYVLTASHCLVDENYRMKKVYVTVENDDGSVHSVGRPVGVDTRMDWGLIQGDFSAIPGAHVIYDHFELEPQVLGCGYPHGTKAVVCQNLIPVVNDAFYVKCIGIVFPGMSGGPVFDAAGNVIGLDILGYPAEQQGGISFTPTVGILASFRVEP